jgi:hypothetical protein
VDEGFGSGQEQLLLDFTTMDGFPSADIGLDIVRHLGPECAFFGSQRKTFASKVGIVARQGITNKQSGLFQQVFGTDRVSGQLGKPEVFFAVEGVFAGSVFARLAYDAARPSVG